MRGGNMPGKKENKIEPLGLKNPQRREGHPLGKNQTTNLTNLVKRNSTCRGKGKVAQEGGPLNKGTLSGGRGERKKSITIITRERRRERRFPLIRGGNGTWRKKGKREEMGEENRWIKRT